jgi:hypothetical protein
MRTIAPEFFEKGPIAVVGVGSTPALLHQDLNRATTSTRRSERERERVALETQYLEGGLHRPGQSRPFALEVRPANPTTLTHGKQEGMADERAKEVVETSKAK